MSKATFDQSDEVTLSYDASDSNVPKGFYYINYHTYESNNYSGGKTVAEKSRYKKPGGYW